ncbi:MAG: phosphomannomutase/phosphoglucomutase [Nanobdellota archaeon]
MDPFHAYDIRGIYGSEIDETFAYNLGRAVAAKLKPGQVAVGKDMRTSSEELEKALINGLVESGVDVIKTGRVTTPQFYYSLYSGNSDAGVMITASHNPSEYNGFKIVLENAQPLYKENGLYELKEFMDKEKWVQVKSRYGHVLKRDVRGQYSRMFSRAAKPLTGTYHIITDTGNGMGSRELDTLQEVFGAKLTITRLFDELDGTMPNHECNPIKEEEMDALSRHLKEGSYDFGVGLDGDADRIVFFLPDGTMVPPDITTAILAGHIGREGDKIIVDVRSSRSVTEKITAESLKPVLSIAGHAYIKDRMKEDGAPFGGEKSGHYFYRSLHYTDSSLMTIIKMLEVLDETGETLETLARPLMEKYVSTGEVNYTVTKKEETLEALEREFSSEGDVKTIDGVSVYGKEFFFNARKSNTENLLRVNLEAVDEKTLEDVKTRIERVIARTSPGFE